MTMKPLLGALALSALLAPALRASDDRPVLYLLAGAGMQLLGDGGANGYYGADGVNSSQGYMSYLLHAGLQFERLMTLELSAEVGPTRNYNTQYSNGTFTNRDVRASWNMATLSVMPALTWTGTNEVATNVSLIGLRLGYAKLNGTVTDSYNGTIGSYDQDAQTLDYGLLLRTQFIVLGHFSLGLEGGYNWTRFNTIENSNKRGTTNTPAGESMDFSGPRAALVLGLWSRAPRHAAN